MKKEKALYVMNTEKGAFLKTAEFDIKVTGLDGTEYNVDEIIAKADEEEAGKLDFSDFLQAMLANR